LPVKSGASAQKVLVSMELKAYVTLSTWKPSLKPCYTFAIPDLAGNMEQESLHRPAMETPLRSPPIPKEEPDAPTAENAGSEVATRSWHPLHALLQLRAFEALRYRDYRLIWYGQVFASMGTWMDQVTRGWLIYE